MNFKRVLVSTLILIFLISGLVFASSSPTVAISTVPASANTNGWFNAPVSIHLSTNDSGNTIKYCMGDTNSTPDGCLVFVAPNLVQKNPADYSVFSGDLSAPLDANTPIRFYATNSDASTVVNTAFVAIDTKPPTQGVTFGSNSLTGTNCVPGGGKIYCDMGLGIIAIPTTSGVIWNADPVSGIDYCEFNMDYVNSPLEWSGKIKPSEFPLAFFHAYSTMGQKYFEIRCTDKAGNVTTSTSSPIFSIRTTGLLGPSVGLSTSPSVPDSGWFNGPVSVSLLATPGVIATGGCIQPSGGNIVYSASTSCTLTGNLGTNALNMVKVFEDAQLSIANPEDGTMVDVWDNGAWHSYIYSTEDKAWNAPIPVIDVNEGFVIKSPGNHQMTVALYGTYNAVKEVRYCIGGSDRSDGCFYEGTADKKSPADFNVYVGPITVSADGNTRMKYYALNNNDANSGILTSYMPIDTAPPSMGTNSMIVAPAYKMAVQGSDINYYVQAGEQIKIFFNALSDGLSGIASCQANFDYPSGAWSASLDYNQLKDHSTGFIYVQHTYNSAGIYSAAIKCVDNAGNASGELSPSAKIAVTQDIIGVSVTPSPAFIGSSINVSVSMSNPGDVNSASVLFYSGDFNVTVNAVRSGSLFIATITPDATWPAGSINVLATTIMQDGTLRQKSTSFDLDAPTCSDGIQNQGEAGVDCGGPCNACQSNNNGGSNSGSRGGGSVIISTPIQDTNKALDTNHVIDTNKPVDVNAPKIDNNSSVDTNKLNSLDLNKGGALGIDSNSNTLAVTSPASGFFGLFGGSNVGNSWVIPILIILLALAIIGLYIRRGNLSSAEKEEEPATKASKKKWEAK